MRKVSSALACVLAGLGCVSAQYCAAQTPHRIPRQKTGQQAAVVGRVTQQASGESKIVVPVSGADITLQIGNRIVSVATDADGIFRLGALTTGTYLLSAKHAGFQPFMRANVELHDGEMLVLEIGLIPAGTTIPTATSSTRQIPVMTAADGSESQPSYREISRRPTTDSEAISFAATPTPDKNFVTERDRWDLSMPDWERYGDREGEYGWTRGRWFDPFNRNRIKGDKPVIGQDIFLNFTGTSTTAFDGRRLPVPSGASAANPGSQVFFGKGGQAFVAETVRLSFDLFHGDTSFKPVDWRIRVTPAFNVNQLWARERGAVNIDVREGTSRFDSHFGLQEAFGEVKIHDLSPNYDFVSLRAGIQQFSSDFRGFIFTDEQPGVRVFGNLRSNRVEYNAAYFQMMEKDTNSGLNKFRRRQQQVLIGNVYIQDFFFHGYTTQFSYHFNKDDASLHYDENDFLTRPAPIGAVQPHNVRAHYIGWTGNGHIGKLNINHAAYQVLGHDDLNPIAGHYVDINAQMAAVELSVDHDWLRYRTSVFYASGDKNARDSVARGFDSIDEAQTFAGGDFAFFNREGIRLTGTGVALTSPDSFLPDLRSSKEEGQSNFVNPGIFLVNAGVDADLTPKLKAITNVNFMRFDRTSVLDQLLFQSNIASYIGTDYSLGLVYRPPLTDNITLTGGVSALQPGLGLRQIYTSKTLVSGFVVVRFQF